MRIGIDLGGTKIEAIALDNTGSERYRERINTPQNDYSGTLKAIHLLVTNAESHIQQTATVGLGIPGAISPATGLVKNANSTWLIGQPLKTDLESLLSREIKIENDANCFVVSEATDGAARDAKVVFGVIIGTGTGGGICINKQVLTGKNAIAGEWGHNPLPWQNDIDQVQVSTQSPCYCGKPDCIETFLSGPGFEKHYQHLSLSPNKIPSAEIVSKAQQGDKDALTCMTCYEDRLAKSLAHIINVIDPDVIVLGGGMSNIERLYTNVPKLWGRYVFSDHVSTQLLSPMYGDSSGVRGAAWLWPPRNI